MAVQRPPQPSDEGAEMLSRHLDGDPRAFGELMDRYGNGIYAYLYRSGLSNPMADDLFQETFLRVHRSARRYDQRYAFSTWIYSIANNLVRSHWRKQKVRRVMGSLFRRKTDSAEPEAIDPVDSAADPEQRTCARERLRLVEQALQDLPEGPRRALMLTRIEGMSLEQAARVLSVPLGTVKTWVRRGRLALAECLAQAEQDAKGEES